MKPLLIIPVAVLLAVGAGCGADSVAGSDNAAKSETSATPSPTPIASPTPPAPITVTQLKSILPRLSDMKPGYTAKETRSGRNALFRIPCGAKAPAIYKMKVGAFEHFSSGGGVGEDTTFAAAYAYSTAGEARAALDEIRAKFEGCKIDKLDGGIRMTYSEISTGGDLGDDSYGVIADTHDVGTFIHVWVITGRVLTWIMNGSQISNLPADAITLAKNESLDAESLR